VLAFAADRAIDYEAIAARADIDGLEDGEREAVNTDYLHH
jgi:hypothetical protein